MITPIFNYNNYNIPLISNNKRANSICLYTNSLKNDSVHFTSKLLNKSSEKITKEIWNAVKEENFLGDGVQGNVYKIPNTEYCVKLLNKNNSRHMNNWNLDITPQDRINHVVAKADNGNTIMKYIQGETLDLEEKPDAIYSLPKIAYKKLLKQIDNAHRVKMAFDNAPMNIIYNPEQKSLTAIDFCIDYGFTYNPISDVYSTLYNIPNNPKLAKNLSKKLLSLSLDEIEKGAKSEIPLSYNDISLLIDESKKSIAISSKNNSVQDKCEELKKSYKNIFELREKEDYNSKNYTQEVNKSRELLNEIMR